jgi:hypothetical protein
VPNPSFVSTVLIDCIRYSTLLRIITDVFYQTDGITIRKSEQNVYKGFFSFKEKYLFERFDILRLFV